MGGVPSMIDAWRKPSGNQAPVQVHDFVAFPACNLQEDVELSISPTPPTCLQQPPSSSGWGSVRHDPDVANLCV